MHLRFIEWPQVASAPHRHRRPSCQHPLRPTALALGLFFPRPWPPCHCLVPPQSHGDANKYWASVGPQFHGGPMVLNASLAREKAFRQSGMFARKVGAPPRCVRRRHQLRRLHLRLCLLLRTCHRPPHRCHHSVTTTIPRPCPLHPRWTRACTAMCSTSGTSGWTTRCSRTSCPKARTLGRKPPRPPFGPPADGLSATGAGLLHGRRQRAVCFPLVLPGQPEIAAAYLATDPALDRALPSPVRRRAASHPSLTASHGYKASPSSQQRLGGRDPRPAASRSHRAWPSDASSAPAC